MGFINLIQFGLRSVVAGLAVVVLTLTWASGSAAADVSDAADLAQTTAAQAVVMSTSDPDQTLGKATFTETADGLEVSVSLSDVPSGYHGFHIHEAGSCADGGKAAGGHYNPMEVKHGYLPSEGLSNAHVGDLGNIFISASGSGTLTETIPELSINDGTTAIADLAVILHAERDDFGQPTGNAGGRIGCGLIE